MTPTEYRNQLEESIKDIAEWSDEKAMIVYRLLHLSRNDCRMDGIEYRIDAKIREKCAEKG